jgi:hypothetical protein
MSVRRLFKDIGGFLYQTQVSQDDVLWNIFGHDVRRPRFLDKYVVSDKSDIHLDGCINRQTTPS